MPRLTAVTVIARLATPDDVPELVRLRGVMYDVTDDLDAPWRETCAKTLHEHLSEPDTDWVAFVVERPDEPGRLASCAIAVIERRLPSPSSLTGLRGHVFNVATDSEYRRRGYARAAMEALLGWFAAHGIDYVTLGASPDGRPLYEKLGFELNADPAMRLRLSR
jgi:ribosomal protein S18 acetylase RimI-like enzyme